MKKLPERYYDLVLERDQLIEEADYALNHSDILEYVELIPVIKDIEEELHRIELDMKSDDNGNYYIIAREVYVVEEDEFYSFINEYSTVAEAMIDYAMQVRALKEAFIDYEEICESEDSFYIRDKEEVVSLALHEVSID